MTFFRGQKVVCVDGSCEPGKTWRGRPPVEGNIYTVAGFVTNRDGKECVTLVELKRHPKAIRRGHPGYDIHRFRPICDRPTNISMFTEMLKDKHVEVEA